MEGPGEDVCEEGSCPQDGRRAKAEEEVLEGSLEKGRVIASGQGRSAVGEVGSARRAPGAGKVRGMAPEDQRAKDIDHTEPRSLELRIH